MMSLCAFGEGGEREEQRYMQCGLYPHSCVNKCAHLKHTKRSAHASNVPQVLVEKIDYTFIAGLCMDACAHVES